MGGGEGGGEGGKIPGIGRCSMVPPKTRECNGPIWWRQLSILKSFKEWAIWARKKKKYNRWNGYVAPWERQSKILERKHCTKYVLWLILYIWCASILYQLIYTIIPIMNCLQVTGEVLDIMNSLPAMVQNMTGVDIKGRMAKAWTDRIDLSVLLLNFFVTNAFT